MHKRLKSDAWDTPAECVFSYGAGRALAATMPPPVVAHTCNAAGLAWLCKLAQDKLNVVQESVKAELTALNQVRGTRP